MLTAVLALTLTLSPALGAPAPVQGADVAQLMRDACVATEFRRAAFERLGRERRWRAVRMTQTSGEPGWHVVFRAEGLLVMMDGFDHGESEPGDANACTVSVERAPPGLADEVAALAVSLGLESEGPILGLPPGVVPIHVWSRFGDRTLSYAAAVEGPATLSLSRQVVIHSQQDPVPVAPADR